VIGVPESCGKVTSNKNLGLNASVRFPGIWSNEDQEVCELKKIDKSRVAAYMGIIKCFLHLGQIYILSESECTKG
jgi:hypothetical protein